MVGTPRYGVRTAQRATLVAKAPLRRLASVLVASHTYLTVGSQPRTTPASQEAF